MSKEYCFRVVNSVGGVIFRSNSFDEAAAAWESLPDAERLQGRCGKAWANIEWQLDA